ncbi:hypothetical protein DF268_08600 [Streptomyces sp. V2]|uniref:DUF6221 family protein n=1 Tax=Streptomyces sp. V2 TaxID=1424099 RepID=UPI000D66E567|nr:DUF6221 family protein [Streptomyces sp. V2]PWG13915.1 hypothetical protein DF268_08600 [Streptomyces sp. V2]
MDLVEFLRARLDEDAELARPGETWTAFDESPSAGTRRVDVDYSFERVVACTRSWRALHIAAHDPARVLREIDAKRRIVARVTYHADIMGWDEVHGDLLRSLALPYADHPDYRKEWRP